MSALILRYNTGDIRKLDLPLEKAKAIANHVNGFGRWFVLDGVIYPREWIKEAEVEE